MSEKYELKFCKTTRTDRKRGGKLTLYIIFGFVTANSILMIKLKNDTSSSFKSFQIFQIALKGPFKIYVLKCVCKFHKKK